MNRKFVSVLLVAFLTAAFVLPMMSVRADVPSVTVCLEGWEWGFYFISSPYFYVWTGERFELVDSFHSTRTPLSGGEATDYILIENAMAAKDGSYSILLSEERDESSYTDVVKLMVVDHAADVSVASDNDGNVMTYKDPYQPVSAVDDYGNDVLSLVSLKDNTGFHAYETESVTVDFGSLDTSNGARLVLRYQGFVPEGPKTKILPWGLPGIYVQVLDESGQWVNVERAIPYDMNWKTYIFDLSDDLPDPNGNLKVRIQAVNAHDNQYDDIDYIALDNTPQAPIAVTTLSPESAVNQDRLSVLSELSGSDDVYAIMTQGDTISVTFPNPAQSMEERDFIFVTEGYYVPTRLPESSFRIYTWDGSAWILRGIVSLWNPGLYDITNCIVLAGYLPDPDGYFRVRMTQRLFYDVNFAYLDQVTLIKEGVTYIPSSASGVDLSGIQYSDNARTSVLLKTFEVSWDIPLEVILHQVNQIVGQKLQLIDGVDEEWANELGAALREIDSYKSQILEELKTKAEDMIGDAESYISDAETHDLDMADAVALLTEAESAYESGEYEDALRKALDARQKAIDALQSVSPGEGKGKPAGGAKPSEEIWDHFTEVVSHKLDKIDKYVAKLEELLLKHSDAMPDPIESEFAENIGPLEALVKAARNRLTDSYY